MRKIHIVCATPLSKEKFWKEAPLAKYLSTLYVSTSFVTYTVVYDNKNGLPLIYNSFLQDPECLRKILLFVHDDVSIEDAFLCEKLSTAIEDYDIVGVAGGSSLEIKTPALWHLMTSRTTWSGAVAHKYPNGDIGVSIFGPTPKRCLVLDGLFLAINTEKVKAKGLWFDPKFRFHHFDIQFGLDANGLGLKLTTWPIWVVHSGLGDSYQSPEWRESEKTFLDLYNDSE